MACTQTLTGITRDCLRNIGGIRTVWIANHADIASIDYIETGTFSGFNMKTAKKFYEYQFARGTASLSSNYQVNAENGTKYVQSDLVLVFNRMDTTKRNAIRALLGAELVIVAEDNNGQMWVLGANHQGPAFGPAVVGADSDSDGLTGTAYADRNGYSITFHWVSPEMPWATLATPPTV